jgi:hypothetical protein
MTNLLVIALATWQAVEVWHHSALFARPRDRLTAGAGFLARVLGCPWCLSVWIAALATAIVLVRPWGVSVLWPLAGSRLANLASDLSHPWCRTPRADGLPREPALDAPEVPPDVEGFTYDPADPRHWH